MSQTTENTTEKTEFAQTDRSTAESSSGSETYKAVTKRRVGKLLGERKRNLSRDGHIESYNFTDANGDKIHRVEYDDKNTGTETIDANLSKLLAAASSTSSNIEVLRIEAQQAAEAGDNELETMNPHIPSTDGVLEAVSDVLEEADLVPAWEVVDGG